MACSRRGGGRFRAPGLVALALYALVLLGGPVLHHDLACHLKSPSHCTSCLASPSASSIEQGGAAGATDLLAAGRPAREEARANGALLPARSTGRSPPR